MEVVLVERKLQVGKESAEVVDALAALVEDVRAGKDVAMIASENLPGLVQAVDGYDRLDDELKDMEARAGLAGYLVSQTLKALGL